MGNSDYIKIKLMPDTKKKLQNFFLKFYILKSVHWFGFNFIFSLKSNPVYLNPVTLELNPVTACYWLKSNLSEKY